MIVQLPDHLYYGGLNFNMEFELMRKVLIFTTAMLMLVTVIPDYSYAEDYNDIFVNNNGNVTANMPDIQKRFIEIVKGYQGTTLEQMNDIQKRLILKKRGNDLKTLNFDGSAQNWTGNVSDISAFGDSIFFRIEVAPKVILFVSTDIEDAIVEKISPLQEGQRVVFSGKLKTDSSSGFSEVSFTTDGGIEEPEFKFTLTDIKKLN